MLHCADNRQNNLPENFHHDTQHQISSINLLRSFRDICPEGWGNKFEFPPTMPSFHDSQRGLGIFSFTTASRPALRPTQPSIQWVPGALSMGVKRPVREANHSPPSSAELKECVKLYVRFPNAPSLRVAPLKKSTGTTLPLVTGVP